MKKINLYNVRAHQGMKHNSCKYLFIKQLLNVYITIIVNNALHPGRCEGCETDKNGCQTWQSPEHDVQNRKYGQSRTHHHSSISLLFFIQHCCLYVLIIIRHVTRNMLYYLPYYVALSNNKIVY